MYLLYASKEVLILRINFVINFVIVIVIIVQQAMMTFEYQQGVSVISDDTYVFILLIHHYMKEQLTNFMVMESPIHDRSVIDICSTVKNEEHITHYLLACHALSGCDTVAGYFGIGKVKALTNSESRLLFVMSR